MITVSTRAARKLNDWLVQRCLDAGLGCRIIGCIPESSHGIFNLQFDKEHPGDKVVVSHGIRIFLDPANATQLKDYELDYLDGPTAGFCLKTRE